MSSSTGIVEFRDKGFVLDLKLLFIIVDCFSRRFPPRFFTVKLVCFLIIIVDEVKNFAANNLLLVGD